MAERICQRCKTMPLLDETEIDFGICGECADVLIQRDQERREWNYYHSPDEPTEPSNENVREAP